MKPDEYRILRESLGTKTKVADALGVHRQTIAKRELGNKRITGEAALAMAHLASQPPDIVNMEAEKGVWIKEATRLELLRERLVRYMWKLRAENSELKRELAAMPFLRGTE